MRPDTTYICMGPRIIMQMNHYLTLEPIQQSGGRMPGEGAALVSMYLDMYLSHIDQEESQGAKF